MLGIGRAGRCFVASSASGRRPPSALAASAGLPSFPRPLQHAQGELSVLPAPFSLSLPLCTVVTLTVDNVSRPGSHRRPVQRPPGPLRRQHSRRDLLTSPRPCACARRHRSAVAVRARRRPRVVTASATPVAALTDARVLDRSGPGLGPTRRPEASGGCPAQCPAWAGRKADRFGPAPGLGPGLAGSEAGLLCRTPSLQTGLGRPVGRPIYSWIFPFWKIKQI